MAQNTQVAEHQHAAQDGEEAQAQIRAQKQVVAAWDKLSAPLKAAILAIVGSATGKEVQ